MSLTAPGLSAGGQITIPLTLKYGLTGPNVAPLNITANAGFHLHITTGEQGNPPSSALDVPIDAVTGTAVIPGNPLMTGARDLTIALVGPKGQVITQTTYSHIRIDGPK